MPSDGTTTNVASITLSPGTYILHGFITSGYELDSIFIIDDTSTIQNIRVSNAPINAVITSFIKITAATTFYVAARTWASNATAGGSISAMQIK